MKIEKIKNLDIENISGDFDTQKASISEDSKGFLFEMLANIYSDPVSSICREITSNCFDSHIEAKVNKAVVIAKKEDEEGTYISFQDFGVGLSPLRMSKIYMNYGTSTKRGDNNSIGGFGLGSKTPLSYTDYFYINTISNKKIVSLPVRNVPCLKFGKLEVILDKGIKYEYIFSKGEEVPQLELLNEEETDLGNGTEIKIYIKENDKYRFESALKSQLCYFDSVYFKGWNISNYYKIYETDLYKFRNDYNNNSNFDEMHIALGKVFYPIDWKKIGEDVINIPVGIKFEIGELIVTPNRENLRYTEEVKALVKERVRLVKEELIKTYQEQNKPKTDFKEWYELRKSKPFIKFGELDKLVLVELKEIDKKYRLELFEGINFYYKVESIYNLLYDCVKSITGGTEDKGGCGIDPTDKFIDSQTIGRKISVVKSLNMSSVKTEYFRNGWLFKREDPKELTRKQILKDEFYIGFKIEETLNDFDSFETKKRIIRKFGKGGYFNLGLAVRIHKINNELRRIFEAKCIDYDNVPQDFIKDFNRRKRDNDASLQRRLQGKVYCKDIADNDDYDWNIYNKKTLKKGKLIYGIEGYKGIIVYGNREDRSKLEKAYQYLLNFKSLRANDIRVKPLSAKVILIAQSNNKHFNKKNMVHVDNLYTDNKLFRKFASCLKIEEFFKNYLRSQSIDAHEFVCEITKIQEDIGKELQTLLRYRSQNYTDSRNGGNRISSNFKEELLDIATKNNWFDPIIENIFEKVEKWFEGIEILKYTDIKEESLPYILKYLREKGKKLNYEYYCKYIPEIKERIEKDKNAQIIIMFPEEQKEETQTKFQLITKTA